MEICELGSHLSIMMVLSCGFLAIFSEGAGEALRLTFVMHMIKHQLDFVEHAHITQDNATIAMHMHKRKPKRSFLVNDLSQPAN